MRRSVPRTTANDGGNGWQSELPPSQLTLNFEPSLAEVHGSLREFVAFRVVEKRINAVALAGKMDLAPSTLSRKLSQKDGDSNRLTCDDLEAYLATHPEDVIAVCEYLAAKFSPGVEEARRARVLSNAERLLAELAPVVQALRGAA